jgi:hypothetical protein
VRLLAEVPTKALGIIEGVVLVRLRPDHVRYGDRIMASIPVKPTPTPQPAETVEEKFQRLAAAWEKAVAHHSSSRIRNNHPAYQEIIGMGQAVVPLLLRDLEINRRHWFTALSAITGADPVPEEDAGRIPQMAEAWLRWGRENGYQW